MKAGAAQFFSNRACQPSGAIHHIVFSRNDQGYDISSTCSQPHTGTVGNIAYCIGNSVHQHLCIASNVRCIAKSPRNGGNGQTAYSGNSFKRWRFANIDPLAQLFFV